MKWLRDHRKYLLILAILVVVELVALYYPLDFIVYHGGQATDLSPYVIVENGDTNDVGTLYMLSIYTSRGTGALWIRSLFDEDMDIKPIQAVMPQDMSMEEYQEQMKKNMSDSQKRATLLALQTAGLPVEVEGGGLLINGFTENTKMKDVLREGDVLLSFQGQRLLLNEDLQLKLKQKSPGDTIGLTVLREGVTREVEGVLVGDENGNAKLGIYISPQAWSVQYHQSIEFADEEIGGGSAGLMMTLQILNQLIENDITAGHQIAGTGTIRLDGSIGPIEGVRQKLRAAEQAHAEYFLVASENAEQAKELAKEIQVVSVATLQEALQFLQTLPPRYE